MSPRTFGLLGIACALSLSGVARAERGFQQEAPPPDPATTPAPSAPPPASPSEAAPMNAAGTPTMLVDSAQPDKPDAWADTRRYWLYTADPTAPPPLHVLATVGAGYASIDKGAARPFAANVAHAGAVFSVGGELGIVKILSFEGQALLASQASPSDKTVAAGTQLGLVLHPLPEKWPVQASVASGYLRELGGDNGFWFRAVVAGSASRFRFGVSALGEHVFPQAVTEKRDPLDVMLTASATVEVVKWAQLGAEYVVQDLEEAGDPEGDDGGVKHFVGLTASIFPIKHLQILAGPSLGLSQGAPRALGRGQVSYYF